MNELVMISRMDNDYELANHFRFAAQELQIRTDALTLRAAFPLSLGKAIYATPTR